MKEFARSILALLILTCLCGCEDDTKIEQAREAQRQQDREEASRRLEAERQRTHEVIEAARRNGADARHTVERERHRSRVVARQAEVKVEEARLDRSSAITLWLVTAIALVFIIFILARERYLRRLFVAMARRAFRGHEEGQGEGGDG